MGWVWFDDKFTEHPKILRAGPVASWLFVRCVSWANRHLTDGFVPAEAIVSMHGRQSTKTLVDVGLLEIADGGYRIHDYLAYQRSRAEAEQQRVLASAGGKARALSGRRVLGRFAPAETPVGHQQDAGASAGPSTNGNASERLAQNQRKDQRTAGIATSDGTSDHQPTPTPTPTIGTTVRATHVPLATASASKDESEVERLARLETTVSDPGVRESLRRRRERLAAQDSSLQQRRAADTSTPW